MISRVAESVHWLGRYVERAESMARFLGAAMHSGDAATPLWERWQPYLIVSGELDRFVEQFGVEAADDREQVLRYLTWAPECPVSVWQSWRAARENARVIREALSTEVWDVTNRSWLWLESDEARALWRDDPADFYRQAREAAQLFTGAATGTMLDDEPLRFLLLGMWLERAGQVARVLDVKYHAIGPTTREKDEDVGDLATWVQVLVASSAYDGFFRKNRGTVRGYRVARFLVFDPQHPRSIVHSLRRAQSLLHDQQRESGALLNSAGAQLDALVTRLDALGWEGLIDLGVHEGMTQIVDGVAGVCEALYSDYFSPPVR